MRIVCPTCAATYDVPDSLLTGTRAVRCARCHGQWTPEPPEHDEPLRWPDETPAEPPPAEPTEAAPEPAEPVPPRPRPSLSAMDRLAAQPTISTSSARLRVAWAASLVLVLLLCAGAYAGRAQILHAWPPSARMYAAFGLQISPTRTP